MMDEATWNFLNTATVATLAVAGLIALWRAYTKRVDDHVDDLRQVAKQADEQRARELADLRARTMVIEDNLHIDRKDRLKYLPNLRMPPSGEMKDFDLDP